MTKAFLLGIKTALPISTGVAAFGLVMGKIASENGIDLLQSFAMNGLIYAGTAQLAAVELMSQHAAIAVIVVTGLLVNSRFLLYSAALSPRLREHSALTKFFASYCLTDQAYMAMEAKKEQLPNHRDAIDFYFGSSVVIMIVWHLSVVAGLVFGNFAPPWLSLEFAVPLSFVALLIPTLKDRQHVMVAIFSGVSSLLWAKLPYNLGLLASALPAIALGAYLSKRKRAKS